MYKVLCLSIFHTPSWLFLHFCRHLGLCNFLLSLPFVAVPIFHLAINFGSCITPHHRDSSWPLIGKKILIQRLVLRQALGTLLSKTFHFSFSLFKNSTHNDHFLIGRFKRATNEKILGFISLTHHLHPKFIQALNHSSTPWAHGFHFNFGPRIIY